MSKNLREAATAARDFFESIGKANPESGAATFAAMLTEAIGEDEKQDAELAKLDALLAEAQMLQTKGPAMPLRKMFAAQMLAAQVASAGRLGLTYEEIEAKRAIKLADALLAALAEEPS